MANKYADTLKRARNAFNIWRIGEAPNRQAELFLVVSNLTSSGYPGPCPEFTSGRFTAFFKVKTEAICANLNSTGSLADPKVTIAAPSLSVHLVQFDPETM